MSVTLVSQPSNGIAWSKNPSILSFVKTGLATSEGSYAYMILSIPDSTRPTIGQTLILSWTGNLITFTFAGGYNANPTDLTDFSGTLLASCTQLVADLNANTQLAAAYTATLLSAPTGGTAKILIKALKKGSPYSFITADMTASTMYLIGSNFFAGTDPASPDDYSLYMAVCMTVNKLAEPESSDTINLQAVAVPATDSDRLVLNFYDLKEIGRSMLASLLPFSAFKPYIMPAALAYAQIQLTEYYNGQNTKALTDSEIEGYLPMVIMNGGIALSNYPASTDAYTSNGRNINFLTWQNRKKVIDANQPEWLSVYLRSGYNRTVFTIYYSDGSTDTQYQAFTNNYKLPAQVWNIPTGWNQCGLGNLNPGKVASYYTVYIEHSVLGWYSTTELMTYILDTRYFRQVRYFLVLNSLGGYDTFRTVGNNQLSAKYTRTINKLAETVDTRASDGTIQMAVNEEEQTWTLRSGWLLNKTDAEYYRQLLLSTYVAEIMTPLIANAGSAIYKQVFRSVQVQPTTMNFYEDTDGKWSIEWKMNYAHSETNYSALAPAKEQYFDSTIEFTVDIIGTGITVAITANSYSITVNGVTTGLTGSNVLNFAAFGEYHVVINAEGLTGLSITNTAIATIDITRIASATLSSLSLAGFTNVHDDYLLQRLLSLYNLATLTIDTSDSVDFSADDMIVAALQLYQGGLYSLTSLSLPHSTPSALGYTAKATLIAAGISVNTL